MEPRRCLGVVMPCFNEQATLKASMTRVLESPWVDELLLVDDGSTDASLEIARSVADRRVRILAMGANRGKGAAVRRGFSELRSPYAVIQDADLEYDPREYPTLLEPLLDDRADVVFGSRFLSGRPHRVLYFWHSVGNRFLTTLSNMFTDLNLTDMETCFKAFRREVVETLDLREARFGIEPELTAKVAAGGWRVYEVGISYAGRTYAEGKKINWRDGLDAVRCVVRYSPLLQRAVGRSSRPPVPPGSPWAATGGDGAAGSPRT